MTIAVPDRKGEGMIFASSDEVQLAYSLGQVDTHAMIKVRLTAGRKVKDDPDFTDGTILETSVGRVIFNEMLPAGMPYYNHAMRSPALATVISDCHEILGRRRTIDLLDDMNKLGFRESTRSGLSFATDDLITPPSKVKIIGTAEKQVLRILKLYQRGIHHRGGTLQPGPRRLDPRP